MKKLLKTALAGGVITIPVFYWAIYRPQWLSYVFEAVLFILASFLAGVLLNILATIFD